MSSLVPEHVVDVVKLTLKKKSSPTTTITYYLGTEFFGYSEIYTASPSVYPVLAAAPISKRSMGTTAGIRHDVTLEIYSDASVNGLGRSLNDAKEDYEFIGAEVILYKYAKALDALSANAAVNVRQTLEVASTDWSGGTLKITARDSQFKDKILDTRYKSSDYIDLQDGFDNENSPWAIGENVIINAPLIDMSGLNFITAHLGNETASHPNNGVVALYGRNRLTDLDPASYLSITITDSALNDLTISSAITSSWSGSAGSLAAYWRMHYFTLASPALVGQIGASFSKSGTLAASTGLLKCTLYHAEQVTSGAPTPIGNAIAEAIFDHTALTASAVSYIADFQDLITLPAANYCAILSWSNITDTTNVPNIINAATGGKSHYRQDKSQRERGFATIGTSDLGMSVFHYKFATANFDNNSTYSSLDIPISASYGPPSGSRLQSPSTFFKCKINGMEDDGSGTYTGSANSVIKNPADVIRFILLDNTGFGLGISSAKVDTSTLSTIRTALGSDYNLSFSIDGPTSMRDLIVDICSQCHLYCFNTRAGKFSLGIPAKYTDGGAVSFDQYLMQDELEIISINDGDYSKIVNNFSQVYDPNKLEQPRDETFLRRARTNKFSSLQFLNSLDSSENDVARETKLADSVTLYGTREYLYPLDKLDPTVNGIAYTQNYFADRYSSLRKQILFRVPTRKYFDTVDLFTNTNLQHEWIPKNSSSTNHLRIFSDGDYVETYDHGIPILPSIRGQLKGQIIETYEQGEWIYFLTEETGVF